MKFADLEARIYGYACMKKNFLFLNGDVICEAIAALSCDAFQNMEDLIDEKTSYLFAFRTDKEFRGQRYFSLLFKFMINDLISRGYEQVVLGVESVELENKIDLIVFFVWLFGKKI